jgi:hypothetical protein
VGNIRVITEGAAYLKCTTQQTPLRMTLADAEGGDGERWGGIWAAQAWGTTQPSFQKTSEEGESRHNKKSAKSD